MHFFCKNTNGSSSFFAAAVLVVGVVIGVYLVGAEVITLIDTFLVDVLVVVEVGLDGVIGESLVGDAGVGFFGSYSG